MTRTLPDEVSVKQIADFFCVGDDGWLFDADALEDLRVAVRTTLLVGIFLKSAVATPVPDHFGVDMLRDDIKSALESFENVSAIAAGVAGIARTPWPWPISFSWNDLQRVYATDLALLCEPQTSLAERFSVFIRLMRVQLALWSLTFGITVNGYLG